MSKRKATVRRELYLSDEAFNRIGSVYDPQDAAAIMSHREFVRVTLAKGDGDEVFVFNRQTSHLWGVASITYALTRALDEFHYSTARERWVRIIHASAQAGTE